MTQQSGASGRRGRDRRKRLVAAAAAGWTVGWVGWVGWVGVAAGCRTAQNDRPTLGGALLLPAIDPTQADAAAGVAAMSPTPLTFERENWEVQAFIVPVDGTVHHPTYHRPLRLWEPENRRTRGLYPTLLSALETRPTTAGREAGVVAAAPFLALGEAALIPVRFFTTPGWRAVQTPGSPPIRLYKRSDGEQWYSGTGAPLRMAPGEAWAPAETTPAERRGDEPGERTIRPGPSNVPEMGEESTPISDPPTMPEPEEVEP